jgi:hypothetical protein
LAGSGLWPTIVAWSDINEEDKESQMAIFGALARDASALVNMSFDLFSVPTLLKF